MFSKFELLIAALVVVGIALAAFLVQRSIGSSVTVAEVEQVAQAPQSGIVFVVEESTQSQKEVSTAAQVTRIPATDENGNVIRMVIDDIREGTGTAVTTGDTVLVHYAGNLEAGQEFDNSRKRGEPLEFTVGAGQVITGWEEGLIGMKVGGERILVIPPEKAYGEEGIGPIPGNATLVFKVELLDIVNG